MTLEIDGRIARGAFERGVAFSVARGEVLGLVGRNGAGKSTVLHTIAGLVRMKSGSLSFDSNTWDGGNMFVHAEDRNCSLLFQDLRLFPTMSAIDNVAFAARSRGADRAGARDAARDALERTGALHLVDRRPSTLSGGERQRVAVARALVSRPDVLLLDEPFAAVDADSRGPLRDTLSGILAGFGGCTVLVSHDRADIENLAHRTVDLG